MGNSFFAYLQLVELLAFFSGYPLLYAVIHVYAGKPGLRSPFKKRLISLLPYAYALVGVLYLALQLKNLYPDYSIANIKTWMQSPWLVSWAFLSLLFWIPSLAKKTILSLVHSLVFSFIIAKDIFRHFYNADSDILKNDMNLFTYSLLINLGAMVIIVLFSYFLSSYRWRLRPHKK